MLDFIAGFLFCCSIWSQMLFPDLPIWLAFAAGAMPLMLLSQCEQE